MRYGSRIEKIIAGLRSLLATLRDPPQFTVEVVLDGDPRLLSTSALAVSNNVYGDDHLPYADQARWRHPRHLCRDLDELVGPCRDRRRPGARGLEEPPQDHRRDGTAGAHQAAATASVTAACLASIDGETKRFHGDIEIAIHPKTVKILAPIRAAAA